LIGILVHQFQYFGSFPKCALFAELVGNFECFQLFFRVVKRRLLAIVKGGYFMCCDVVSERNMKAYQKVIRGTLGRHGRCVGGKLKIAQNEFCGHKVTR
jgi:hypothetical protein